MCAHKPCGPYPWLLHSHELRTVLLLLVHAWITSGRRSHVCILCPCIGPCSGPQQHALELTQARLPSKALMAHTAMRP